jgi:hypothetical protein
MAFARRSVAACARTIASAIVLSMCACGGAGAASGEGASAQGSSLAGQRVVGMSGSRVRLSLPPGFCRPTRQMALVNRDGVALVVIEGNLPSQMTAKEWLAGLRDEMNKWATGPVQTSEIKRAGAAGTVARMSLGKQRTMVADLAGENGAFATVIATYDPRLEKTAEAVVSSVDLDSQAPLDPFAMLGLRLSDTTGFDLVAGPVPPVELKQAAASPSTPGATYSVAVLPLPSSPATTPANALRDVLTAQLAMHSVDLLPNAVSMATIDGMSAAEATVDEPGEDGAKVYAAALMDKGAILFLKGRAAGAQASQIERFQRMTRSLRRVPDAFKSLACE